ncbi:MAG: zinc-dependent metalloprotease, partial [Bdellovibrionales bacterium]
ERALDKRDFVDLKLKEIQLAFANLQLSEIKDIQLDDGYFSFLANSDGLGGLVRFSFLNTKQYQVNQIKLGSKKYESKTYFRDDQKLFGFFKTVQENIDTFDRSRSSQREQFIYVNRYNPTRPTIEFRLNHNAPAWTEEVFLRSVAGWNAAFRAAGSPIKIVGMDQFGKALRGHPGDLRYSLVNIYADVDGASNSWGGLGPSLADTHTGEIIMATANVNTSNYTRAVEVTLNNFLMSQRGLLDKKYIIGLPMPSVQAIADVANKSINLVGQFLGIQKLMKLKVFDPQKKSFVSGQSVYYDSNSKKFITDMQLNFKDSNRPAQLNFSNQYKFEGTFNVLNNKIADQVKLVCPELQARTTTQEDLKTDLALIKSCAHELAKPILIAVTLHEMGHNFGLRHNFYGSTDYNNFYQKSTMKIAGKDVPTQWHTSSIMDYMT